MTYLCELCGKPGVYRYPKGFQMVACRACVLALADGANWQPVQRPTSHPDHQPVIDQWRQQRYGMMPEEGL